MVNPEIALAVALGGIAVQRVVELRLARRNEAWARAQGAREVGASHYRWFFVLHVGWLIGWPIESFVRGGPQLVPWWWLWAGLFVLAQGLRYWAIRSLGRRWNTRILVQDGLPPIRTGPYRWLAHPNYVAVALELASAPLVFGATVTAIVASILNAGLLLGVRIPAEVDALEAAANAARDEA